MRGRLTNRSCHGGGINWADLSLFVTLAVISVAVGAYRPSLRIPVVVTGVVAWGVIGLMKYRWSQWQYWATTAILLPLSALFNAQYLSRLAQSQWLLMFPFAIGEFVLSVVVISRLCPVPERYKEFSTRSG